MLRRLPLSEAEVADLETELTRLSNECGRLDAAIEAMEFVASNAEALSWDDAPAQAEANRSLVPALQEQLRRAEEALAEAEANAAEDEFERATAKWQDADGRRRAAVEQLRPAERRKTAPALKREFDSACAHDSIFYWRNNSLWAVLKTPMCAGLQARLSSGAGALIFSAFSL